MPSLLILLFLGFLPVESASASDPRFEDHKIEPVLETCAPLDFMSTSLSRNHQERILARKPDLKRANFGGKYLLLNLPLMMEDLWLIVDCSTGKFLKPTLDGKARFRPESLLVELKTKEGTEWQVWRNGGWSRLESTGSSTQVSTTPSPASGLSGPPCAPPDYRSYFKADAVRENLLELNPEPGRTNYFKHYRVLKNELLFETRWFLLDCRTGTFEKEVLTASRAEFSAEGEILTLRDEGKFPRRLKWARQQWIETPDPARPDQTVRNPLEGQDARRLYALLPNPAHHHRLDFEDLVCEQGASADSTKCRVKMTSTGAAPSPHVWTAGEASWIYGLVRDFGSMALSPRSNVQTLEIRSGFCTQDKSRCEFETGAVRLNP
jgi:hypothetical protein